MSERLNWGLIGGGEGSQIGFAHRIGAELDGKFKFAAGALDVDPQRSREYGKRLGLAEDRAYGNWKEMLDTESSRDDRIDLVTVATPNETHFEISKAFLDKGFHVFCEKPLTTQLEDAKTLVQTAEEKKRVNAVNFGYSGYPLVRQMRAAVQQGELGKVRVVFAEFAGGLVAGFWPTPVPGSTPELKGMLLHSSCDSVVPYSSSVALNNAMLNAGHSPELVTLRSSLNHNWDRSYNQTQWDFFMASAPAPVPVPAMTPIGILSLVALCIGFGILELSMRRKI